MTDSEGNANNQLEVEEGSTSSDGDSDSWEKVSIPETSLASERITVVERIFSLDVGATQEALTRCSHQLIPAPWSLSFRCGAEVLAEEGHTDTYWDTPGFQLVIRSLWLRRREGGVAEDQWQLRILEKSKLTMVTEEQQVVEKLEQELGLDKQEGRRVEDVVKDHDFKQILSMKGSVKKWRLGGCEVEVRQEGEVVTALLRVVGEVMGALQELQTTAEKLLLLPLQPKAMATGAA